MSNETKMSSPENKQNKMTCSTCAYWETIKTNPENWRLESQPDFGICRKIRLHRQALYQEEKMIPAEIFAFLEDGENYYAALRTKPTFSCTEYVTKEQ
jgi:hypothetical protein